MSDIRQTVGDLDTLLTSAFDGTEFVEVFPTSGGVSKKTAAGTAVSSDVQTSLTDTTADRLMKVGAGGWLGNTIVNSTEDYDDITASGYYYATGSTNRPYGEDQFLWIVSHSTGGRVFQFASGVVTNRQHYRIYNGSSWTSWVELYHSGNYPSDTEWTTPASLLNVWTGTVRYIKRAGMVTVIGSSINGASRSADTMLNLASVYRPGVQVEFVILTSTGSAARGILETGGNLRSLSTDTAQFFTFTYPVIT